MSDDLYKLTLSHINEICSSIIYGQTICDLSVERESQKLAIINWFKNKGIDVTYIVESSQLKITIDNALMTPDMAQHFKYLTQSSMLNIIYSLIYNELKSLPCYLMDVGLIMLDDEILKNINDIISIHRIYIFNIPNGLYLDYVRTNIVPDKSLSDVLTYNYYSYIIDKYYCTYYEHDNETYDVDAQISKIIDRSITNYNGYLYGVIRRLLKSIYDNKYIPLLIHRDDTLIEISIEQIKRDFNILSDYYEIDFELIHNGHWYIGVKNIDNIKTKIYQIIDSDRIYYWTRHLTINKSYSICRMKNDINYSVNDELIEKIINQLKQSGFNVSICDNIVQLNTIKDEEKEADIIVINDGDIFINKISKVKRCSDTYNQ